VTFCKTSLRPSVRPGFRRTSIRDEALQANVNDVQFSGSEFCFKLCDLCDLL
jgi:hypothetical protein